MTSTFQTGAQRLFTHSTGANVVFVKPYSRNPVSGRAQSRKVSVAAKRTKSTTTFDSEVESSAEAKVEALQTAISRINSRFGKGSLFTFGDKPDEATVWIPSGCLSLDAALGGGYPRGKVVEIFGPESSGKTTLALHAVAEFQKAGKLACFIDAEHAFDKEYARRLGVNVDSLSISQPDSGEMALEVVDELCRAQCVGVIVIDSVSALVPRAELDGEIGQTQVGSQARLMSSGLRKLCGSAMKSGTTLIFINQLRYKVGVMYGNPETTSGGNALKFYASIRIDVRRKEKISGAGDEVTGFKTKVKVVKNKCAPPYREANFDIIFGLGIDSVGGMVDAAERVGVLVRKGAWYSYGTERLGQGREKTVAMFRADPELAARVEADVSAALRESPEKFAASSDDEGDDDDDTYDVEE